MPKGLGAMITKIISGGQTGVDRAALDFAIKRGIPHGGFCPRGRLSESGRIATRYNLEETSSANYAQRTALNVQHADGTLILTRGAPEGGTSKTVSLCDAHNKPRLVVDLDHPLDPPAFAAWVRANAVRTLNVAGPRESKQPGIGRQGRRALSALFAALIPREAQARKRSRQA